MIVTNTSAADLALTNLAYCSHADLHGFVVPGTKLYLASITDSSQTSLIALMPIFMASPSLAPSSTSPSSPIPHEPRLLLSRRSSWLRRPRHQALPHLHRRFLYSFSDRMKICLVCNDSISSSELKLSFHNFWEGKLAQQKKKKNPNIKTLQTNPFHQNPNLSLARGFISF
ncbi:hypothetical protein CMV_009396 [Castanea mollissima]|uniref:Uncharacterized protein n=1 Tax=Castanea mollissima TaxID=60419 RepID=A0A8J4RL41_9ROSI|nr:hypothetical protein CMV_009396 [Castanea mollissima]